MIDHKEETWDDTESFCLESADDTTVRSGGERSSLAAQETRAVYCVKWLVFFVLVSSMAAVGTVVYLKSSNSEESEFEVQFAEDAKKVLATLGGNLDRTLEAMDAFTVSLVSFARYTKQTWPFVVIPDFAVRAEKIRTLAGAVYINTYPLVDVDQRDEWESFTSLPENHGWIDRGLSLQEDNSENEWPIVWNYTMWDVIHGYDEFDKEQPGSEGINSTGPWLPLWQIMPIIPYDPPYNWDLNSTPNTAGVDSVFGTHKVALTEAYLIHLPDSDPEQIQENIDEAAWISNYLTTDEAPMEPISDYLYPIIDNGIDQLNLLEDYDIEANQVVGMLSISVYWRDALKDILPDGSEGIVVVFENECNPSFTYQIDGANAKFLGVGDLHQSKYEHLGLSSWLNDLRLFANDERRYSGRPLNEDLCPFRVRIYPSDHMKDSFTSSNPVYFTCGAVLIFSFTTAVFVLYDCFVERRHRVVNQTAVSNKTIVDTLFPKVVRERLEEQAMQSETPVTKLKYFINSGSMPTPFQENQSLRGKPIAELFPHTTVMFADIAGFTAWASVRDPSQVFTLLENLYAGFDRTAKKRKVFKVETIGDCYVAVCGLPEPRENHANVMCMFAHDCRETMKRVTKELETTLGPGTTDLSLRSGLHSGPTTAGVLRGEKARFQLFGDTVNTASRMESTGLPNMIQVSQKTADLVIASNKGQWVKSREKLVNAKGKGMLQTYFVEPVSRRNSTASVCSGAMSNPLASDDCKSTTDMDLSEELNSKLSVLIGWNSSVFEGLLEEIFFHRKKAGTCERRQSNSQTKLRWVPKDSMAREEVSEMIIMPTFDPEPARSENFPKEQLSAKVKSQLQDYIARVADLYPSNAFHNFEHASHVMMSVVKLLQRIATSYIREQEVLTYTNGISSDPVTKFAVAFAALIHDADHQGVSNTQLAKEESELAIMYKNKSVAEQNSIDLAWSLFIEPHYEDLRAAIYTTEADLNRFRQLVVNCVIATDIFDKDLKSLRENRWDKAFPLKLSEVSGSGESASITNEDDWHRKATIVIEYIIQASDVAHTMQHWHIYQKWNGHLFDECYQAYKNGRAENDPAVGWYEGELWFFDNYIIPLAKKLKECEVFGVCCDEFLDFAYENRKEWAAKGKAIVEELKSRKQETV